MCVLALYFVHGGAFKRRGGRWTVSWGFSPQIASLRRFDVLGLNPLFRLHEILLILRIFVRQPFFDHVLHHEDKAPEQKHGERRRALEKHGHPAKIRDMKSIRADNVLPVDFKFIILPFLIALPLGHVAVIAITLVNVTEIVRDKDLLTLKLSLEGDGRVFRNGVILVDGMVNDQRADRQGGDHAVGQDDVGFVAEEFWGVGGVEFCESNVKQTQ